jgi:pyruvate kinase
MATIGPTLEKLEDLKRAIEAGAVWFRLPCGYRQRPHLDNARTVREAAKDARFPIRLLLDLPSSRPRTGTMTELRLTPGDQVVFWDPEVTLGVATNNGTSAVPLPGLAELMDKLVPRQRMWFCDGRLNFVVDELREKEVLTHMVYGTVPLKSSNSLFLPDSPSPFSAITPLDSKLLRSMADAKLTPDWVALSLIATPQDVRDARAEIHEVFGPEVKIMAKFETVAALEVAEEIMEEAEGIMVARGDLGLAVGYIRLPEAQERLVSVARSAGKVTVVATQVMEAFAETGLPQRAELSDLSLIARQRADAVMLGKETVYSPRPIECIRLAREVLAYETLRFEKASKGSGSSKRPTQSLAQ